MAGLIFAGFFATATQGAEPAVTYASQGPAWSSGARNLFYTQDQGAQMIPLAWLEALKAPDGQPFLSGSLARYGYLPNPDPASPADLPVGFTLAASDDGPMVGMTCAACHTRQITIAGRPFRIDGGPAIVDFETFLADLDAATLAVLVDKTAFDAFAASVLGGGATNDAKAVLQADLAVWSVRFDTLMSRSLPTKRRWGTARLDAVSMIFNRLAGLDIGTSPTYLLPENIRLANAPVRYPFLWNASRQNRTQWPGFADNGTDFFALFRNLAEVYGVFGLFHPERPAGSITLFDRNYLVHNSGNFEGLGIVENLIQRLGPPTWQWPVDQVSAARGKVIYETTKTGPNGGETCAYCHGIVPSNSPPGTWNTPIVDVGTDRTEWLVLGRSVFTGSLQGASIPNQVLPLAGIDSAVNTLKISGLGAIIEFEAQCAKTGPPAGAPASIGAAAAVPTMVSQQTDSAAPAQVESVIRLRLRALRAAAPAAPPPPTASVPFAYESRVLQGIWAAAPYLHNGSVPTLADLLKPAAQRPKSFAVGPAYDLAAVGLAAAQPGSTFTLQTTGCDDLMSGDSNCGHEYGTQLSDDDKKALLDYMKTL